MMFKEYFMRKNGEPWLDNTLRVRFNIDVFPGNVLSLAEFDVFNLADSSKVAHGDTIEFIAGTKNRAGVIFTGTVVNVFRTRDNADIYHKIICRTGVVSQRGSISATYGTGAKLLDVIKDVAKAWPLRLDIDEKQFEDAPPMISGYSLDGDLPSILNRLADEYKFTWTEYAGRLIISRQGEIRSDQDAVKVSMATGMEGVAEVNRGPYGLGVWVAKQLDPFIFPNTTIELDVQFSTFNTGNVYFAEVAQDVTANGKYNVLSLVHRGDTHGDGLGSWTTEIDALRNDFAIAESGGEGLNTVESPNDGTLVWGARVSQEFRAKTRDIADRLRTDPNFLMAVMAFETGGTFNPAIRNAAGSSATGLIQFMSKTATNLGTSTDALARMSAVEQLDWVYKYYKPFTGKLNSLSDAYMAVLYPVAVGRPSSYVLFAAPSIAYNQNAGLDHNRDGKITKEEATVSVARMMKQGMKHKGG